MEKRKNCSCEGLRYNWVDRSVRRFVQLLHEKGICTNSSEGGGARWHAAPDFAYVEAHLTRKNLQTIRKTGFLLSSLFGRGKVPLFDGNTLEYGKKTGFYVIGICRKGLSDSQTEKSYSASFQSLHGRRNTRFGAFLNDMRVAGGF